MRAYIEQISGHDLFYGIQKEKLPEMLDCLGSYTRTYQKNEIIILSREPVKCVGIILSGMILMVKEQADGSETLLAHMKQGELFGETFACGTRMDARVTFRTAEKSEALFLPFYKVLHACSMACVFHHRLIENMVRLICEKNIQLMEKVEVTSQKTLRDKILTYLRIQADRQGADRFEIPLKRTELAEYLCADRSALTRELARMKAEGLISYNKNTFYLK